MSEELLSDEELIEWRKSNYLETMMEKDQFEKCVENINKVKKGPESVIVEIWVWNMECYSCHNLTEVVYPEGEFYGYSLELNTLENLPVKIAEKYPTMKIVDKKTKDITEYGNTCSHCGAYQGDWFVFEDYLNYVYSPELLTERIFLEIPLTDDERIYYTG
jgi:hypothetical protein